MKGDPGGLSIFNSTTQKRILQWIFKRRLILKDKSMPQLKETLILTHSPRFELQNAVDSAYLPALERQDFWARDGQVQQMMESICC